MSGVRVVTDSTAYLPADLIQRHGLTVVPLQVVLGGRSLAEGVEVSSAEVAQALAAWQPVTTSRPSPATFAQTYRRCAELGAETIVSVHLSGELSGTVEAARAAAHELRRDGVRVEVIDSRSLGMGLGLIAITAAEAAERGEPVAEVVRAATRRALSARVWLYVDTLEYLRRGGRINAAQATVGTALAVKPLLQLIDGRLEPLERVRTASRALARLEDVVVAAARADRGRELDVAVHHLAAPARAQELAERLGDRLSAFSPVASTYVGEVGAVVGAHVGPGMLGVALLPR